MINEFSILRETEIKLQIKPESLDSLNFLNDLNNYKNIVIKEADNVGSVVILSKPHLYKHNIFMAH